MRVETPGPANRTSAAVAPAFPAPVPDVRPHRGVVPAGAARNSCLLRKVWTSIAFATVVVTEGTVAEVPCPAPTANVSTGLLVLTPL